MIDLTIDGGSSGFQFDWSNGATTEDIFNLEPGTYNVQAVDGNGCIAGAEFVVLEPFLPIIVNGTVKNAVNQHDGSIDITSVGGEGNFSYLWSNGSTSEDINNLSPGIYTVVVTDGNNCSASSTFVVSTTAGLANVEMSTENIQLYPNPANTYVIIEGKGFTIDKIEVVDVLGQISFSSEFKESKVQLNTSGLEQGVYFVKIQSNKKEVIKKLNISK